MHSDAVRIHRRPPGHLERRYRRVVGGWGLGVGGWARFPTPNPQPLTPEEECMSESPLLYDQDGHVGIITFNRPDKLNALSPSLMQQLNNTLDRINADDEVRCLILTGAGDRAFSVGFDLDGLQMPDTTPGLTEATDYNFRTILKIWNLRIPAIAAVN